MISCEFAPQKSVRYQLAIEGYNLCFDRSRSFLIKNLASGKDYSIVAIAQDANNNEVEHKVVEFKTSGEPDNTKFKFVYPMLYIEWLNGLSFSVIDEQSSDQISIISTIENECSYYFYLEGEDYYSESEEISTTDENTTIFTGLTPGKEYSVHCHIVGMEHDPLDEWIDDFTKK